MNKRLCSILLSLLLMVPVSVFSEQMDHLNLLTHTSLNDIKPLALTPDQRQWLQQKKVLRMGVFAYDSPPYSLITLPDNYEGLNADYISIIGKKLGLEVQLVIFQKAEERLRALRNNEIDVIPNSTAQYNSPGIVFSEPYNIEYPILAVSNGMKAGLPADLDNFSVAVAAGYWPLNELKKIYPKAIFKIYDNYQQALSAVAFGDTQVYLGPSFLVSRNFINNLRIERFSLLPPRNTSFSLNKSSPLAELINSALNAVPVEKKQEMQEAWMSNELRRINQPLDLTKEERNWISHNPNVSVLLYGRDNLAPVAFIDSDGTLRGIATDVLNIVTIKTGLKFNFKAVSTLGELEKRIHSHDDDMVAAMTPSNERAGQMLFTYPYIRTAFSLITNKKNNEVKNISDLRGKKLGILKGAALINFISENYPEIKLVIFDNDEKMFSSAANNSVDAIVGLLITSDYKISLGYRERLKVVNVIGSGAAFVSFALGKDKPELKSILNKVLISLPPEELSIMANRWRPNNLLIVDDFWGRNRILLITLTSSLLVILLFVVIRSIWLRKSASLAAAQAQMLEKLLNDVPFPISLRDLQGRLTYCNQYYLSLVNVPFNDIKGTLLTDHPRNITYEQAEFFQQKADEVIASSLPYIEDIEVSIVDQHDNEQKKITANIWMLPWRDGAGKVIGVVGGLWDVSERATLLQQLSEASDRAEASNRAKSTFLSTMSHEIRTPMNAIIGMLDMAIKKGRQGQQDLQALEVAQQSAEGLVGLIGDILDLSRVEGGELEFRPQRINLGMLINQLLVIFNGLAIDKNILLHKNFPSEAIPDVMGDPLRIKQVLSNVLGNAIKFTDTGGVTLDLRQEIREDGKTICYTIDVTDSGIGIDESQQAKLFQPFSQADNRRAGTGLGLFISRNLCKVMGGDLTLYSVQYQGTRVRAEIVLTIAEAIDTVPEKFATNTDSTEENSKQLSVLVVDDNAANRMLLAKQLAWLGHHAHIAEGGEEAIELWRQQTFDVIITDCNMPRMNGYQFTQFIRENERIKGMQPVWILGFTANAMHEIIERCLASGMNGCLFKPCTINSLSDALNKRGKLNVAADQINLSTLTSQDNVLQQELMHRLETSLREDYISMTEAVAHQNWVLLADLSHRVMGSVRIMRESKLAEACQQVETACLAIPLDVPACYKKWQQLQQQIESWLANVASEK
ncbi:transporter substrate-binding domain-containing protein [Pantoea sp. GbtcB22]|uniref:transporter substrate-binding domain-containing protein n=1 Tax=Pantoea sp. GbtcB22 TaxID=2824767 RepID=UPI0020C737AF|nr:transporter substrate-binding domain-containing protein [Pantoea sp. GbtcB22]